MFSSVEPPSPLWQVCLTSLKGSESGLDWLAIRPESALIQDLNRHVYNMGCFALLTRIIRARSKPGPCFDQPSAPESVPDSKRSRNKGVLATASRVARAKSPSEPKNPNSVETSRRRNPTYPIYLSKHLYSKSNASLSLSELGLF